MKICNFVFVTIAILLAIIDSIRAEKENASLNADNENDKLPAQSVPKKQQLSLNREPDTGLYYSRECQNDIAIHCPKASKMILSDIAVLQCIHNEVQDLSKIDQSCHNLLFEAKKNLTVKLRLDNVAMKVCQNDLQNLRECSSVVDKEDNGHLISCLLSSLKNITQAPCENFLKSVAALVFSDYRLVYNFIDDCSSDIAKHSCGRIEKLSVNRPTQQGHTIQCLTRKLDDLEQKCRKQIMRIVELQSDDFQMDRSLYFACKADRERLCENVPSGSGRVYKCLLKYKFDRLMSKECQDELTRRQKIISENVEADKSLIAACKSDIMKHECRKELRNKNYDDKLKLANLVLCLEGAIRQGAKLEPECGAEILEHRKAIMSDYLINKNVATACKQEISSYCGGGSERGGKTLHCLIRKAKQFIISKNNAQAFSQNCLIEIKNLIKIADPSEDIRVDSDLKEACQPLLNTVCKNVEPGKGRVIECLLDYLNTPSMIDECEERLLEVQFFIARDWSLTPKLFKECRNDAVKLCNARTNSWTDWTADSDMGFLILPCLYHHIHENEDFNDANIDSKNSISMGCANEVKRVMLHRAKNINLMPQIQENCATDLAKHCSFTSLNPDEKGAELKCLQTNYRQLEQSCKDSIKEFTQDENQDLRLDQILMKSCTPIIEEFCAYTNNDEKTRLLECLIAQKQNPRMHAKCRAGIEHHQLINMQNIEFNRKFVRVCKSEISEHCASSLIRSKLEIVQCLSEIVLKDTLLDKRHKVGSECRQHLRSELFQLNENIKLDADLDYACQEDVRNFCSSLQSGKGQILECLRENLKGLSQNCKTKLSKRDRLSLVDSGSDFTLQTKCKNAIKLFCDQDENEDLIACLRKHLLKPTIEQDCKKVVISRIMLQNKDSRLNPTLWKTCSHDINKKCSNQLVINFVDFDQEFNGRVLRCLKKKFVENTLSSQCRVEVDQIMREAANIDYRLDPLLADACLNELEHFCSDASNDKKEDCLRLAFHKQKINPRTKCFNEIRRVIVEGAADLFVDRELSEVCALDLTRYCNEIPPGASQQLKCLLDIKEIEKNKLVAKCVEMLADRQELWKMADLSAMMSKDLQGLNDLARLINKSQHRSYLLFWLVTISFCLFITGCYCSRAGVLRRRRDKRL